MGYFMLARNHERQAQYEKAAQKYNILASESENAYAPAALQAKVSMWLKAAMALGAYSAITAEEKEQWSQYLSNCEQSAIELIERFPSSPEVPQALDDLIKMLRVKSEANQVTSEEANDYFKNLRKKFESPLAQARIYAAEAGLYFQKNQFNAAYDTFKNLLNEYPDASLGAEDWNRYATLLLTNKELDKAFSVFSKIQKEFPRDQRAMANATYGLGATYLAQGKMSKAIPYFEELKAKYPWSEKIMEAEFALAMGDEQSNLLDKALDRYRTVIMSTISTPELKAQAMLASGKILEKQNKLFPNPQTNDPNAESFYLQPDAFFRDSTALISAEGLYLASQINIRQNNIPKAKEILQRLLSTPGYSQTSWHAKAQEALSKLP
jgi:tetratricopeptide (TPR) repeat protein